MTVILRNAMRCRRCGDLLESEGPEVIACRRGDVYIAGGREYLRRGWRDGASAEDLTEFGKEVAT